MPDTLYTVTPELARYVADLPRIFAKVDGLNGEGVRNSPWGITIGRADRVGGGVGTVEGEAVLFVRVKQSGGANGDGTLYATYTYDAYDFADATCTGTAMTGGPFAVLNGGSTSYSSGSAARIAPWGVNVAPTGSPAELVTRPDSTRQLRNVGETVMYQNCTTGG